MPFLRRPVARTIAAGAVAAATGLAYASLVELRWFTLRSATMPVLPFGHDDLTVLHLSDLHLTPGQHRKREWLHGLGLLRPDLVVSTGDLLGHPDSVPVLMEALGDLLDVPGVYVRGSNDYYAPTVRNPVRYLLPDDGKRHIRSSLLPWPDMVSGFEKRGWLDLDNRSTSLVVGGTRFAFAGVDDPHLGYDDLALVAGPGDPTADVRVALAHAPYLRVLDQFAADGYEAVFAGHTHGGQICLPGKGAIVTNCDLEPARAKGLHRHPAEHPIDVPGGSWLHVSAGLGTSPYAPVRFCCRPEATLLTLTPGPDSSIEAAHIDSSFAV
ncbi:metallophosphoesterase [soil metagenome]